MKCVLRALQSIREGTEMNRSKRKIIGEETVKIAERGWYELPSGVRVDISDRVSHCLSGTRLYSPQQLDDLLATVAAGEKTDGVAAKITAALLVRGWY